LKSEKHTLKEIIDLRLKRIGGNIADVGQVIEEFDIDPSCSKSFTFSTIRTLKKS